VNGARKFTMATPVWQRCLDRLFLGLSQFKKSWSAQTVLVVCGVSDLKDESHITFHPVKDDEQSPESRSTGLI